MTTFREEIAACPLCGKNQQIKIMLSTSSFGSADLDTRPPLMARAAIDDLIHRCRHCNYIWRTSGDVEEIENKEHMRSIVDSGAYRNALSIPLPPAANLYLARSVLDAGLNDYALAGWNALHAAWVCDDDEHEEGALRGRRMALKCWQRAEKAGQSYTPQDDANRALLCDLLRRCGEFERAQTLATRTLEQTDHEVISQVLEYTIQLCKKQDNQAHTIEEALKDQTNV